MCPNTSGAMGSLKYLDHLADIDKCKEYEPMPYANTELAVRTTQRCKEALTNPDISNPFRALCEQIYTDFSQYFQPNIHRNVQENAFYPSPVFPTLGYRSGEGISQHHFGEGTSQHHFGEGTSQYHSSEGTSQYQFGEGMTYASPFWEFRTVNHHLPNFRSWGRFQTFINK